MSGPWIVVVLALWIAVMILAVIQIGILRRVLPVLDRAATLPAMPILPPVGTVLPAFEATLGDGSTITTAQMVGQPFVLFFVSQACAPCRRLLLQLEGHAWATQKLAVYLVVAEDAWADMPIPACVTPLLEHSGGVSRAFRINTTPLAVAVDRKGMVIESIVPRSSDDLDRLQRVLQPGHGGTAGLKEPERAIAFAVGRPNNGKVNNGT